MRQPQFYKSHLINSGTFYTTHKNISPDYPPKNVNEWHDAQIKIVCQTDESQKRGFNNGKI